MADGTVARFEQKNGIRKLIRIYREIMKCPDGLIVDHVNRNRLDNRKSNLRICTVTENSRNRSLGSNNKFEHTGVDLIKGKWRSRITYNGKQISLGYFMTRSEAVTARRKAERSLFKAFSPNQP